MFLAISLLFAFASTNSMAQTHAANMDPIASMEVTQPRAFGYYLGDKFQRVINLTLNKPYVLDEAALPKPGKMIPWLSIGEPEVEFTDEPTTNSYRIVLPYQIINIDKEALDIGVEGHEIGIKSDTENLTLLIRSVRIKASMIADKFGAVSSSSLEADALPLSVQRNTDRFRLLIILAVISYVAFLFLALGLPFQKQQPAFTQAFQEWRKKGTQTWSPQDYDGALKHTHRAFNETAGRVVFLENLEHFLSEHPHFESEREQIRKFYEHSRDFYFSEQQNAQSNFSEEKIIDLLRSCSELERGMA